MGSALLRFDRSVWMDCMVKTSVGEMPGRLDEAWMFEKDEK